MAETWFTSDHHFGHKNILEYEKDHRPFSTVEEMNEVLIERWNSVVNSKDVVYHLGDFAFGKRNVQIAERLNGKKRLIMGNHDVYPANDYLKYFDRLHGVMFWRQCVLTHVPIHPNDLAARCLVNVHGHLHGQKVRYPILAVDEKGNLIFQEDTNYFNVSVEQNNLTPINSDRIMERIKLITE